MSYRPNVYNSQGNLISGKWYMENTVLPDNQAWDERYSVFKKDVNSSFFDDYVIVQHIKSFNGGSGPEEVVEKILKVELNNKDISFLSLDDRMEMEDGTFIKARKTDIIKDHYIKTKYKFLNSY
jgi:hypothetical protein